MHKITFEPSVCKPRTDEETGVVTQPAYSGTVTMRMPSYDERMAMIEGKQDGDNGVKFARTLAKEFAPQYVEAVAITRLEDGFVFSTWEDLNFDSDMAAVISEIVGKLVGKYAVGKSSTPS